MNNNQPKSYDISVIVPVYNAEKYISQCIKSILNQTKNNIEIIIVNDGCTDGTPQIIRDIQKENSNIHIIDQSNGGLASARITGLSNATGKYVGWVDADDFIKPEMYQVLYDHAENTGADYVYCDYEFYPHKIRTKEKWYKNYNGKRDWKYIDRNTQCWNTLTKRQLLQDIGLCDTYLRFEEYSWISVMLNAKKVESIDDQLYYYRVGEDTMSGGSFIGKLDHFRKGAKISSDLKQLIKGTEYEAELEGYMEYRYIYTLIQLEIVAAVNSNRETYKEAKEELNRMNYKKNPLTKKILDENHGKIKSFIMRNIITSSYNAARIITKVAFN